MDKDSRHCWDSRTWEWLRNWKTSSGIKPLNWYATKTDKIVYWRLLTNIKLLTILPLHLQQLLGCFTSRFCLNFSSLFTWFTWETSPFLMFLYLCVSQDQSIILLHILLWVGIKIQILTFVLSYLFSFSYNYVIHCVIYKVCFHHIILHFSIYSTIT